MNNRVVAKINLFDAKQEVITYQDNLVIDTQKVNMEDLKKTIIEICEKYSIKDISLVGPKKYLQRYASDINNYALNDSEKYNIEII